MRMDDEGGVKLGYTQENFEEWVSYIPEKMEQFTNEFAKENHLILDYTMDSLDDLERWILDHYSNAQELIADSEILDRLTIYLGETVRNYIGGRWVIDLKNKKKCLLWYAGFDGSILSRSVAYFSNA